ncbi:MAG TPA: zinc ribbon domain-containing protein [Candidatus Saccharimonadales bacterium]|nr:zinc ribbon domain-containing protein [Candidatus Saccharimonadales bacterium]
MSDVSSCCPKCEASQRHADMQLCPICHAMMKANAHFCLTCGTRIQRVAVKSDDASILYDDFAESDLPSACQNAGAASVLAYSSTGQQPTESQSREPVPQRPPASAQIVPAMPLHKRLSSQDYKALAVLILVMISVAVIWWAFAMPPAKTHPSLPASRNLNAVSGTRWRGNVGRSPAFLDISRPGPAGDCTARISYEGIIEELAIKMNADGSLVLAGTGYHRESGVGTFALDTFYGQLSADGRRLQGSLIDGSRRRGQWNVIKIETTESLAVSTTSLLSPNPTMVSHWQGTIGKWPASLDILPRKTSGEWTARGVYRGVVEDFAVTIKDDGSIVLAGTSYYRESGTGPFSLDTLYGQLSADGQRLQGLRIDIGSRGQWSVTRTGSNVGSTRPP